MKMLENYNYIYHNKMKQDIKQIEEVKNKIIDNSSKGFKYFIKNALLVILIFLGCWIFTNPDIVMNPSAFVKTLTEAQYSQ